MRLLTPVPVPVQRSESRFLSRNIPAGCCEVRQSKSLDHAHGVRSAVVSCTYRVFQHLLAIQVGDIFRISVFETSLLNGLTITSNGTRLEVFDLRYLIEDLDTTFNLLEANLTLALFCQ